MQLSIVSTQPRKDATAHDNRLEDGQAVDGHEGQQPDAERGCREGGEAVHVEGHAEDGGEDEADGGGVHARQCTAVRLGETETSGCLF